MLINSSPRRLRLSSLCNAHLYRATTTATIWLPPPPADGIPEPVIKWRRESQTFELPVLEDIETMDSGSNQLDDRHEQEPPPFDENAKRTGDRLRQDGTGQLEQEEEASESRRSNGLLPKAQVALRGPLLRAANSDHDDTNEATKNIVKRQSASWLEPLPPGRDPAEVGGGALVEHAQLVPSVFSQQATSSQQGKALLQSTILGGAIVWYFLPGASPRRLANNDKREKTSTLPPSTSDGF